MKTLPGFVPVSSAAALVLLAPAVPVVAELEAVSTGLGAEQPEPLAAASTHGLNTSTVDHGR